MSIRSAVMEITESQGFLYAQQYYGLGNFTDQGPFNGAYFESIGGADNLSPRITAADLLAPQTLSVTVPARAAIAILGEEADRMTELLMEIDVDQGLASVESENYEAVLGADSPAQSLWDLLRRNGKDHKRWGVGGTTASKIMARKRPRLIPIQDSVVDRVTGRGRQNVWKLWWDALREDSYLEERASGIREAVGKPELSTLRALDVVLWMHGNRDK